jgi:hypothetical protein
MYIQALFSLENIKKKSQKSIAKVVDFLLLTGFEFCFGGTKVYSVCITSKKNHAMCYWFLIKNHIFARHLVTKSEILIITK